MAPNVRPTFGFPLVLRRMSDNDPGEAAVVRIRTGTSESDGFAPIDELAILNSLHLRSLPRHAASFLGEEDLFEDWSISQKYQERSDLLKGPSGQLAGLLAMASSTLRKLKPHPGTTFAGLIWATGCFEKKGTRRSTLEGVRDDDFVIKLKAFLDSNDLLFLAADQNWRWLGSHAEDSPARNRLLELTAVWSVSELRRNILDPTFRWDVARSNGQRFGVRVGIHETRGLLEALFADLPSPARTGIDPVSQFGIRAKRLGKESDDPTFVEDLVAFASELEDWKYVGMTLMEVLEQLRDEKSQDIVELALTMRQSLQSFQGTERLSNQLLDFAVKIAPNAEEVQRALIDHHRINGPIITFFALLLKRGRLTALPRKERTTLLEEAARCASDQSQLALAIEARLVLLEVQPHRTDVAIWIATHLDNDADAKAFQQRLPGLPTKALQASVHLLVAKNCSIPHEHRLQALRACLAVPIDDAPSLSADQVLATALSLASRADLIELITLYPSLRFSFIDHYCRMAAVADKDMLLRFLLRLVTRTGALEVVADGLKRHGAVSLLVRVTTELALNTSQSEDLRQRAVGIPYHASQLDPDTIVLLSTTLERILEHDPSPSIVRTALDTSRVFARLTLRRSLLLSALRNKHAPVPLGPILREVGRIEERLKLDHEAFHHYYEAVLVGVSPWEISVDIDRTVRAGMARVPSPSERLTVLRLLIRWDPLLPETRVLLESLLRKDFGPRHPTAFHRVPRRFPRRDP